MERVRFAPSPTGALHIGGLRTALFNYAYARQTGGRFILRIEDTDQNRYVEAAEEYILKSLEWCGIQADESVANPGKFGPYRQSERLQLYKEEIEKLIANGKAYYAFDSAEALDLKRKEAEQKGESFKYGMHTRLHMDNSLIKDPSEIEEKKKGKYVIRLKIDAGTTVCSDEVRGKVRFENEELEDKILMKSDGFPTYHLANVVDDHHMEITTVIRGEEWLSSLPIHLLLYDAFEWERPKFAHLPLILKPTGKGKLSKRDGETGGFPIYPLEWEKTPGFKERGFLKEALLNTLMLLGWSSGAEDRLIKKEEFVKMFGFDKVQKGGARFDFDKAKWINQQYIKLLEEEAIAKLPELASLEERIGRQLLTEALSIVKERIVLLEDVEKEIFCLFHAPESYDTKVIEKVKNKGLNNVLEYLETEWLRTVPYDKEKLAAFCKSNEIGFGVAMRTLRLILVGSLQGPDVFDILNFVENDVIYERLDLFKNQII